LTACVPGDKHDDVSQGGEDKEAEDGSRHRPGRGGIPRALTYSSTPCRGSGTGSDTSGHCKPTLPTSGNGFLVPCNRIRGGRRPTWCATAAPAPGLPSRDVPRTHLGPVTWGAEVRVGSADRATTAGRSPAIRSSRRRNSSRGSASSAIWKTR
jgi:hypothetical protein